MTSIGTLKIFTMANNCEIIHFNNNPVVDKVIKQLGYYNVAECYRLANMVNSDGFKKYCAEDSVAKTSDLSQLKPQVIERLVRDYYNSTVFNVDGNSKVNTRDNIDGFANTRVRNEALQFVADLGLFFYNKATDTERRSDNVVAKMKGSAKNALTFSLVARANKYRNEDKFNPRTSPIEEVIAFVKDPNTNATEQDKNFADMVKVAYTDVNFWNAAFSNPKVSSVGIRVTDEEQLQRNELTFEESDDDIILSEAADGELDQSGKQWDIDKNYTNFTKHASEDTKVYFNTLPKLLDTKSIKKADGTFAYNEDRTNTLGVPMYHTYQECMIEIADLIRNGGWKSTQDVIDAIRNLANTKSEFASFAKLADDMEFGLPYREGTTIKFDTDFANRLFKDINKFNTDVIEINMNQQGNTRSYQANNTNSNETSIYFNLRNDFKYGCVNADNDYNAKLVEELLDSAKGLKRLEGTAEFNTTYNNIISGIHSLAKQYFPSIDTSVIDAYIVKNKRDIAIDRLLGDFKSLIKAAKKSKDIRLKYERDVENIRQLNARLRKNNRYDALRDYPTPVDHITTESDTSIYSFVKILSNYSKSKAQLNYRNVNGNLQSGLIFNNYITNVVKSLSDPETARLWLEEKTQSKEYAYNPLLNSDSRYNIRGIAKMNPNGTYALDSARPIIRMFLFNGISNQFTGTNKDYTNMSDSDYLLARMYAFHLDFESYGQRNMGGMAPYMMRTPSDAPKNFMVSLPKYSINDLYNIDNFIIDNATNEYMVKFNDAQVNENSVITNDGALRLAQQNKQTNISYTELIESVINGQPLKIKQGTAVQKGDDYYVLCPIIDTNARTKAIYIVKGNINKGSSRLELINTEVVGTALNSTASELQVINNFARAAARVRATIEHPEAYSINTNSAIYNIIRNTLLDEIKQYVEAKDFVATHDKDQQIEFYHYGKNGGNVFHFTNLDNSIIDGDKIIKPLVEAALSSPSSTGGQRISIDGTSGRVIINDEELNRAIDKFTTDWISGYRERKINNLRTTYGEQLNDFSDNQIFEFGINDYIAALTFDCLFEGNNKYYKDPQTFLKRDKEVQAGGTSYAVNYNATSYNGNPYKQSLSSTTDTITVGGKKLVIRDGFNAITIENTNKTSTIAKELYDYLTDKCGLDKERASRISAPFGYNPINETQIESTKVNDAQSYITIYELARRLKLMGEYNKYKDLLDQLTDDTTDISQIDANKLTEFIQVTKNFYYDQYYDPVFKRHVSRQIKNAEFVLIPKYLGHYENGKYIPDTSLGRLCKIMIDNGIDQCNTKETSKAANYEVIEFWDAKTGEVKYKSDAEFAKKAKYVAKPYSYMYLYRQQEVPQHMKDAHNKAGIQMAKKILDNIDTGVPTKLTPAKEKFFRAYCTNIKESFTRLMEKFGLDFYDDGNIVSKNSEVDFSKIYNLAKTEMARLGLDSNMMDYLTVNGNNNQPIMPNIFNIVANKIESIAQSQFNSHITRQKLPGWHAAQVTSLGLEGYIRQFKGQTTETDTGKRVELAYHKDRNIVEVLLPKWASNMFTQYNADGTVKKEFKIEDIDEDVLMALGYRIPTEGKQSMAVLKVVGFLPEYMGSTIVVPDEWVTQTGSDFDVDSVYGISYETYVGRDNRIHKVLYYEGEDNLSNWIRYSTYVNRQADKLIKQDNAIYLNADEKKAYKEQLKKFLESENKEQADSYYKDIKKILSEKEKDAYAKLTNEQQEELKPIFKDKSIKFKDRTAQVLDKLRQWNIEQNNDGVEEMLEVYTEIRDIINNQIEFNLGIGEQIRLNLQGKYADFYKKGIAARAKSANLMTYEEFIKLPIEEQNTREARNNRMLDSIIEILNDPASAAENLARSNFDDITEALKATDKLLKNPVHNCVFDIETQIRFRRNAMSGATLKAFSVSRDTVNSVFNVTHAKLPVGINVKYNFNTGLTYGARLEDAKNAFDYNDKTGWTTHNYIGNSRNNLNVWGEYVTVASSHTTAHILDAIKEGAIPNENEYTFAAFKTLLDIGMDAYSAILWIRQPGITRIVNNYFKSQSVFTTYKGNPVQTTIREIAKELGVQVANAPIDDSTNFNHIMLALQGQYGKRFEELTGAKISLDYNDSTIRDIDVPQMESRGLDKATNVDELLLDLKAVLNFDYINNYSKVVQNVARVLNPDKFGAKQTIFETRAILQNIRNLVDSNQDQLIKDGNDKNILDSIYPKLAENVKNSTDLHNWCKTVNENESSYPFLCAFMKYSTVPSILVNQMLFPTEQQDFVDGIMNIGELLGGTINKSMYTAFKGYVLDNIIKSSNTLICSPTTIDSNGSIIIDSERVQQGSSLVEDGDSNMPNATPEDIERARIFGFNKPISANIQISNINNPSTDDIKVFSTLTPAQKLLFVQQRLRANQVTIFDYLKANVSNPRANVPEMQYITFDEQEQDKENIYRLFERAFFNNNSLIRLTAIDLVKYAFVVEGYKMRRNGVSKIIKNNALYTDIKDGGFDFITNTMSAVNEINIQTLKDDNVYDDFIRSHSELPQIPTYRCKMKGNVGDINPIDKLRGCYYFNVASDKGLNFAKMVGLVDQVKKSDGTVKTKLRTHYIKIARYKEVNLYKVFAIKDGDNIKEITLVPLNKLMPFEHGEFSINRNYHKFPAYRHYVEMLKAIHDDNISVLNAAEEVNNKYTKNLKVEKPKKTKSTETANNTTDNNFVFNLALDNNGNVNNGTVYTFYKRIQDGFADDTAQELYLWCPNSELAAGFNEFKTPVLQQINDKDGNPNYYLIERRRMNVDRAKKNGNAQRDALIDSLRGNGVKNTNDVYYITRREEQENVDYLNSADDIHESSINDVVEDLEESVQVANVSMLGNLAQEFILDIKSRYSLYQDGEAARTIGILRNIGVDTDSIASIEEFKKDTIKQCAEYYKWKASKIEQALHAFDKDPDDNDNNVSITSDYVKHKLVESAKTDNRKYMRNYLMTLLSANTFGNSFPLIEEISTDNLDERTKRDLLEINAAVSRIRNNEQILQAYKFIADNIYASKSTNPLIVQGQTNISDYVTKDMNWIDALVQDAQEIGIPLVQLVLREATTKVAQRNLEAKEYLIEFKSKVQDIYDRAAKAGITINMDNVVDPKTMRFIDGTSEQFWDDYHKVSDARVNARAKGINSREYIRANYEYNKWLSENTKRKYVKSYYDENNANEATVITDFMIDYYIQYKEYKEELDRLRNESKGNRNATTRQRIRQLRSLIANMRSDVDINTGEEKSSDIASKSRILDKYLTTKTDINSRYFSYEPTQRFKDQLEYYLKVINNFRKYDSKGRLITDESTLMFNKDYAEAIDWINENTTKRYSQEVMAYVNAQFAKLNKNRNYNTTFYSVINHVEEPYDNDGIIDGRQFNKRQRDAIREEQEAEFAARHGSNRGATLIRNRSDEDGMNYSAYFYDKFTNGVDNPSRTERNALIRKANRILERALNPTTGKLFLSELTVDELRELNDLLNSIEALGRNTKRSEANKKFLEEEVEYLVDQTQYNIDERYAKDKGVEYYNVWSTVAKAKNYQKGIMMGYLEEPNSRLFGYVRPKAIDGKIPDKYIDNARAEAIDFIKNKVRYVNTKYYEQARNEAAAKGKDALALFEQENLVYNPFTGVMEPIKIWRQMEIVGEERTLQPTHENVEKWANTDVETDDYFGRIVPSENNNYRYKTNANEFETELRQLYQDEIFALARTHGGDSAMRFADSGRFPRRRANDGSLRRLAGALANFVGYSYRVNPELKGQTDVGFIYDRNRPLPMTDLLKNPEMQPREEYRDKRIGETDEQYAEYRAGIRERNREINRKNREIEAKLADKDYQSVMEEFILRAHDANAKEEVKFDLYYLLDYLDRFYKVYETNGFGNIKVDKRKSTDDRTVYRQQKAENATKMVKTWVGRFIDNQYRNVSRYEKIASLLQNIASAKYMMFNITGGIGNVLTGSANIFMERFAGEYFENKDWEEGKFGHYMKNIASYILDANKETANNLEDGLIKMMSIIDYDGVTYHDGQVDYKNVPGAINKLKELAYSPQAAGEHFMQNTAMFAMMCSHRVVKDADGKYSIMTLEAYNRECEIMALNDVIDKHPELKKLWKEHLNRINANINERKNYQWFKKNPIGTFLKLIDNKDIGKEYIANRKKYVDEAKKRFEEYPKLIDQFELHNGYAKLKPDSKINLYQVAEFKGKVVSVNKKIHGVYDRLGGARIETTSVWGSLIMQYHKHMYMGFMKRWRWNGYYNESRQSIERGVYANIWQYLTTEFSSAKERNQILKEDGQYTLAKCLQNYGRAIVDLFLNGIFNYKIMSNAERANFRRAYGELVAIGFSIMGAIAAQCLAMGLDDDDEVAMLIADLAIYQMDKLSTETIMYAYPFPEFKKTWSNPVAIGSSFNDLFSAFGLAVKYVMEGDDFSWEFQSGQYAGENKMKIYLERQIPIYRSINRIMNLDESNSYYKLGDNALTVIPIKSIAEWITD